MKIRNKVSKTKYRRVLRKKSNMPKSNKKSLAGKIVIWAKRVTR